MCVKASDSESFENNLKARLHCSERSPLKLTGRLQVSLSRVRVQHVLLEGHGPFALRQSELSLQGDYRVPVTTVRARGKPDTRTSSSSSSSSMYSKFVVCEPPRIPAPLLPPPFGDLEGPPFVYQHWRCQSQSTAPGQGEGLGGPTNPSGPDSEVSSLSSS